MVPNTGAAPEPYNGNENLGIWFSTKVLDRILT